MPFDPKNQLTFTTLLPPLSRATNNAASAGVDLRGYSTACVQVNVGVQTAGDNAMTFTTQLQSAANNTASEATNISGASYVTTGNNAASYSGQIQVDPRACLRYLFARTIITAGNSPAAPTSAVLIGIKQVQ
jgi:hypothetical protein